MSCSPQRAQAIHTVDEAWTRLIDQLGNSDWLEVTEQLRALSRWKEEGPPQRLGPVARKRLAELAWLALSEAALRVTDERNYGDGEGEKVPCV